MHMSGQARVETVARRIAGHIGVDRMNIRQVLGMVAMAAALGPHAAGVEDTAIRRLDGSHIAPEDLREAVRGITEKAGVTGLSMAVVGDDGVAHVAAYGMRDAKEQTPADIDTVFGAASLSKTVFAYVVMLVVEDGDIGLDTPLVDYLPKPLHEDPSYTDLADDLRYERITARMVLSHTTGFPNWRFLTEDKRLSILFEPGARHSYSGEGIALLQRVVERVTGRGLQELASERVFDPLGMTRTSYVWRDEYAANRALPHDEFGRPKNPPRRVKADAAGSMLTTAGDYARLVTALLAADGRRGETVAEILRPQIRIASRSMFGPGAWEDIEGDRDVELSWGLGWGRFDSDAGRAFFHTGHDFGFQAYTVTFVDQGIGVTLLANSDNLESVAREIVEVAIADTYSPFGWLGYAPFDPERRREPPPEPVATHVPAEILGTYVGAYRLMENVFRVHLEGEQLIVSAEGKDEMPLLGESETPILRGRRRHPVRVHARRSRSGRESRDRHTGAPDPDYKGGVMRGAAVARRRGVPCSPEGKGAFRLRRHCT
ncbi:serine hydrolase [Candidatus Poribacteria bacterium]|nr:serine hydrolase [Candidatus Poribacteria bacterium]